MSQFLYLIKTLNIISIKALQYLKNDSQTKTYKISSSEVLTTNWWEISVQCNLNSNLFSSFYILFNTVRTCLSLSLSLTHINYIRSSGSEFLNYILTPWKKLYCVNRLSIWCFWRIGQHLSIKAIAFDSIFYVVSKTQRWVPPLNTLSL